MHHCKHLSRREFLNRSMAAAGVAGLAGLGGTTAAAGQPQCSTAEQSEQVYDYTSAESAASAAPAEKIPCGLLGKAKISRLMLGGNLVSGYMHARDLKYVNRLFRAYMTEEKIFETFRLAEQHGINTVFETGAAFVQKYNARFNGQMQFIPHIKVEAGESRQALEDHIKQQVDLGAVALYVWGVSGDTLVRDGRADDILRAVELAKKHGLPVGVGSHSLLVPMECEKRQCPCDFYVKTLHADDYPSATPKEFRKEFIWLTGGPGWYDNMWCINPEETIQFMRDVRKPWVAFKVLAAGAILPRQGFAYALKNGADFLAVGMFDFQIQENCEIACKLIRQHQQRQRPWMA